MSGVEGALVTVAVEEVAGVVAEECRQGGRAQRRGGPLDAVRDDPPDVGMVVDGEVLVARAEVEDLAVPAPEGAAATEHLAPRERTDEDELVGHRDVELLAVHLLLGDHDRTRHASRYRMR